MKKIRLLLTTVALALTAVPASAALIVDMQFNDVVGTNVSQAVSVPPLATAADSNLWATDGSGKAVYANSVSGNFRNRDFASDYTTGTLTLTFSITDFSFTDTTTKGAAAGFGFQSSTNTMVTEMRLNQVTNGQARPQSVDPTNATTYSAPSPTIGLSKTGVNYLFQSIVNLDADTYLTQYNFGGGWVAMQSGTYNGDIGGIRIASQGPNAATADPYSISFDYVTVDVIPEPTTIAMLVGGLGGLALLRRRRRS